MACAKAPHSCPSDSVSDSIPGSGLPPLLLSRSFWVELEPNVALHQLVSLPQYLCGMSPIMSALLSMHAWATDANPVICLEVLPQYIGEQSTPVVPHADTFTPGMRVKG
jgi:hypothetical protein